MAKNANTKDFKNKSNMAVVIYSNGITKDFKPKNLVFTEDEILSLFTDFTKIKTFRLINVVNCWCIYGVPIKSDPIELNRIVAEIVRDNVYSHALFVHDTELSPDWKVTENIIYKNYEDFLIDLKQYLDEVAEKILIQYQEMTGGEDSATLPQLENIGETPDQRLLLGFNPKEQPREFYEHDEFYRFSKRIYEYITSTKQTKEPFTIYADKKAVIIVNGEDITYLLNSMIEKFKSKEEYEICNVLTDIMKKWTTKPKKTRKKKEDGIKGQ